jgi:hypothetical protein
VRRWRRPIEGPTQGFGVHRLTIPASPARAPRSRRAPIR